jgi:hypothetical protein
MEIKKYGKKSFFLKLCSFFIKKTDYVIVGVTRELKKELNKMEW